MPLHGQSLTAKCWAGTRHCPYTVGSVRRNERMLDTMTTTLPQMVVAKEQETRHVAFICSKGTLDMAYPALVMGWAALGNGIDVTIFFTFWGLDMINKTRVDHLEIAPVANTSMKMTMMGVDTGNLGIPQIAGVLP